MIEHPNHVEIAAFRSENIDVLQRRKQHWLEIRELSQRQIHRADDEIASCDKQLLDLGASPLMDVHDAVLLDNREIVHYGGDQ